MQQGWKPRRCYKEGFCTGGKREEDSDEASSGFALATSIRVIPPTESGHQGTYEQKHFD